MRRASATSARSRRWSRRRRTGQRTDPARWAECHRARRGGRAAHLHRWPALAHRPGRDGGRGRAPSRQRRRRHRRTVLVRFAGEAGVTRLIVAVLPAAAAGLQRQRVLHGDPVVHAETEIIRMACEREVRPSQAGSLLRFDEAHLRVGDAVGGGHLRAPVDDNLREACFANCNRFFQRYAERVGNVEADRCTGLLLGSCARRCRVAARERR